MKFFLIGIVFVCFVMIGINIGVYYKKRRDFYVSLYDFCVYASSEISFALRKTNEIVAMRKKVCKKEFFEYLTLYEEFLNGRISKDEFCDNKNLSFLTHEELNEIDGAFLSFGQMNIEEELEKLNYCKKNFSIKKEFCLENYKKYKALYIKLFVLLGLIMVVVFL